MEGKVTVGMGEYAVAEKPVILQAIGLGSCVAVCLYDKRKKTGGLAHVFLPDSRRMKSDVNQLRFADRVIPIMIKDIQRKGCEGGGVSAKIFGGSSMFPNVKSIMDIGERNVSAVKKILKGLGIRVVSEDTGGVAGRSVWFDTCDGSAVVSHTNGNTTRM